MCIMCLTLEHVGSLTRQNDKARFRKHRAVFHLFHSRISVQSKLLASLTKIMKFAGGSCRWSSLEIKPSRQCWKGSIVWRRGTRIKHRWGQGTTGALYIPLRGSAPRISTSLNLKFSTLGTEPAHLSEEGEAHSRSGSPMPNKQEMLGSGPASRRA